jgi:hypothetical protein
MWLAGRRKREVRAERIVSKSSKDFTEFGGGRIFRRLGAFFPAGKIFLSCAVMRPDFVIRPVILASIKKAASQLNVVGPQVRKFRLLKGWRQDQLARAMQLRGWDTSRDSVTRLENQVRRVTCMELFIVAKCLEVGADDLYAPDFERRAKVLAPLFRKRLTRGRVPPAA